MKWNWQQKDWPFFSFDRARLESFEDIYLHESGFLKGLYQHIHSDEKNALIVDLMSDEALTTSEIEGEHLNRESLRASIRRCFGLTAHKGRATLAEQGISEMMVDLYRSFAKPLTHKMLCSWHLMLMGGRRDLHHVGSYRTHKEPMQVISNQGYHQKVHFEAPPSKHIPREMEQFIRWFNKTAPTGKAPLPVLVRAGIAHLYFVCIHPFEDGNGRIGRAIITKILSQGLGQPALIALSNIIQKNKKSYYSALEQANTSNEISSWLIYFSETLLKAQNYTVKMVSFILKKTKFYDSFRGKFNLRQEKVINRIFQEGLDGFRGGLSAENYIRITETSRATATRDLQDLVEKDALYREGERKSTRYYLSLTENKATLFAEEKSKPSSGKRGI